MTNELGLLLSTAIFIGTVHTLIGVDHYVPFVAMSKANHWTLRRTIWVVLICGLGHVLSSVVLGFVGIGVGSALSSLVDIESWRGDIAVWFLIAFGAVYTIWGVVKAIQNKPHHHTLSDGSHVEHAHHAKKHTHKITTFWALFVLFVLGPCEPLIPILMYPAVSHSVGTLVLVTSCFAVCTMGTMLVATLVVLKGINLLPIKRMERYVHALAGLSITLCGVAIIVFGI